jgi:hypothetical protein
MTWMIRYISKTVLRSVDCARCRLGGSTRGGAKLPELQSTFPRCKVVPKKVTERDNNSITCKTQVVHVVGFGSIVVPACELARSLNLDQQMAIVNLAFFSLQLGRVLVPVILKLEIWFQNRSFCPACTCDSAKRRSLKRVSRPKHQISKLSLIAVLASKVSIAA